MGTNFYWNVGSGTTPLGEEIPLELGSPAIHIGKRSAAGLYCWDCRLALDERGPFRNACPSCGLSCDTEGHNSAMVELGFQAAAREPVRGVRGASSFSWAQDPEKVLAVCRAHEDDAIIEDEYGRPFTGKEFRLMLEFNCPLQMTDSIGVWFF